MKKITLKNTHSSILNTITLKKAITALSICFIGIQMNAQTTTTFTETFEGVTGLGGNNAAVQITGTSGVTYTQGPATGITNWNGSNALLMRLNGGVRASIDFPLANGVNSLKFDYARPFTSGSAASINVIIDGVTTTITANNPQENAVADFPNLNITSATSIRIEHVSGAAVAIDNLEWIEQATLGVEDFKQDFSVYPNPVKDFLYVKTNNGSSITSFELYDITGRLVKESKSLSSSNLYLGDVNSGLYMLKMKTSADKILVNKILVEK